MSCISVEEKVILRDEIEKLDEKQHFEIFKIFKKYNIPFSENKNGIFLNLNCVDEFIISEIKEFILYLKNQEKYINKFEKLKHEYKNEYFNND